MKTKVTDPKNPTTREETHLALEVLDLLDGLGVAAIADVLSAAAGIAKTYTRFDVTGPWFQQATAELAARDD